MRSTFVDEAFTQQALDNAASYARLPMETIVLRAMPQPYLQPLDSITVSEQRSLGANPTMYTLVDVEHVYDPSRRHSSTLTGLWMGVGDYPGGEASLPERRKPTVIDATDKGVEVSIIRKLTNAVDEYGDGPTVSLRKVTVR
jgi:hypothetical protein